jgi:drug/metabolite transporter (DMT)-like permease
MGSIELVTLCVTYILGASGEYWLFGCLQVIYAIRLPILSAVVQNSSWPFQLWLYNYEVGGLSEPRVLSDSTKRSYLVLGCLSAFVTLTRTMGITTLPPTLYVIVANSEIIFETILTKYLLKREITYLQLLSVSIVIAGVSISLYNPHTGTFGQREDVTRSTLVIGVLASLTSRFASSLNTVLADRYVIEIFVQNFCKRLLQKSQIGFLELNRKQI